MVKPEIKPGDKERLAKKENLLGELNGLRKK
jgi:hypothetical protein